MIYPNYQRRFRTRQQGTVRIPTKKLVVFELGCEKYAISIERVQRVLNEFIPYGSLRGGQSLVRYHEEIITLIDFSQFFLGSNDERGRNYLIVCTLTTSERLGIPVPTLPKILEVPAAQFEEIPQVYRQGALHQAVEKLIHIPDGTEVFYLNLDATIGRSEPGEKTIENSMKYSG